MQEGQSQVDPSTQAYLEQAPTDTQLESVAAPVTEQNGNAEVVAQESNESAPEGTPETNEEAEKIRDARYAGQLEKVRKELEAERQKAQEVQARFDQVSKWAARTPDSLEDALINTSGMTKEEAKAEVEKLKSQGYWNTTPVTPEQQVNQAVDPYKAAEEVFDRRLATDSLIEAYPELKQRSKENFENYNKAFYLANSYRQIFPNMTLKEALNKSYGEITGKSSEQMQEAVANARISGIAEANSVRAASSTGVSAQPSIKSNVNLTPADREMAQKLGMSESNYALRKNEKITQVG